MMMMETGWECHDDDGDDDGDFDDDDDDDDGQAWECLNQGTVQWNL